MKKLHTGIIVLDALDIMCISFSAGASLAYLIQKYKQRKKLDPLVAELKDSSPVIACSIDGKPLKLPLMRGGDDPKAVSMALRSKKLASVIKAIVYAKQGERLFKLSQLFFVLNSALTSSLGLRVGVGGALNWTEFILIAAPSTIGGFLMVQIRANPLASIFLPLAFLYARGIEDVPDPYESCKNLCKAAEEFHNRQLTIEMKELTSTRLPLPLESVPLVCVEEKLSIVERYKLRRVIESVKAQERVQHFSEFIKQFPECDADPEAVYQQVVEKITE